MTPKKSHDFRRRIRRGTLWEEEVKKILESRGYEVSENGYEHTHKSIKEILIDRTDSTSTFIRYQPDYFAVKEDDSILFEPKYSKTIEKGAYKNYIRLRKIGCKIHIFIRYDTNIHNNGKNEYYIYEVPIQHIQLIDGKKTMQSWNPKWVKPLVDENGWLAPRLMKNKESEYYNMEKYRKWKRSVRGSGTSFKYFNFKAMRDFRLNDKGQKNTMIGKFLKTSKEKKKKQITRKRIKRIK